jgi:hypothetical protein
VAPAAPITRKARFVVALAVAGAIPLTAGVLIWVIGSVMSLSFHGGWSGVAGDGGLTALAGLLPGLVMIVLAASGRRETMRARPYRPRAATTLPRPEQNLLPVAPEHQAFLADPPHTDQPPPPGEPYSRGGPMPTEAAGVYPPAQQPWPAPGAFGAGGRPNGQPYYADPALPPHPAQPDDTYPGFPVGPAPFTVFPEPSGTGSQPTPAHPSQDHHGPPPGDSPDFHRERGFPVPPQSRGEGGYRRLAVPEEWW